jgi:hypothetical protein
MLASTCDWYVDYTFNQSYAQRKCEAAPSILGFISYLAPHHVLPIFGALNAQIMGVTSRGFMC